MTALKKEYLVDEEQRREKFSAGGRVRFRIEISLKGCSDGKCFNLYWVCYKDAASRLENAFNGEEERAGCQGRVHQDASSCLPLRSIISQPCQLPHRVLFLEKYPSPQLDFQIIGCINHSLPPARKNTKVPLTDIKNIINFRLHSEHNIVYKWSVYRRADNGEEEYLDSCTLNLREAVNSFVGNQKNYNSHSHSSVIEMGLLNK